MAELKYKRVLLKISGEGLSGTGAFGISGNAINILADQILELSNLGVQPAVVVGAGNLLRGETLSNQTSIHRATADQMGMLATVINSLALQDVLESKGLSTRVMSALEMNSVCEPFIRRRAQKHLEDGRAIILAGGTGNPFFTTDTCASLRAAEICADVLIKATKVDGVYNADPVEDPTATMYKKLSFDEVIRDNLKVMDQTAMTMCRDNDIDVIVCNLMKPGTVSKVITGYSVGTLITK